MGANLEGQATREQQHRIHIVRVSRVLRVSWQDACNPPSWLETTRSAMLNQVDLALASLPQNRN